jgi:hypothetical protein
VLTIAGRWCAAIAGKSTSREQSDDNLVVNDLHQRLRVDANSFHLEHFPG